MEAAAMTCWAHPQSMDAARKMLSSGFSAQYDIDNKSYSPTPAMEPSVFASIFRLMLEYAEINEVSFKYEQPTIHANRFLHLGEDNE
jgi:hypothetical protein